MRDFRVYAGLYDLGAGQAQTLVNATTLTSGVLNTRNLGTPGAPDFLVVGPGSQVWILGYSIRASRPFPFPVPADPLGLDLRIGGSYDLVAPFTFQTEQRILLPVYAGVHHFHGRARVESPAANVSVFNGTGNDLEVSFQFWGKG